MNKKTRNIYTQTKKLLCYWTDKKNYLIHFRMLKFYARHGMIVDKVHEVISFRQSKLLKRYKIFHTQKKNLSKNDFEKDFYVLLNKALYEKQSKMLEME